jgi:hypothetical protein
LEDAIDVGFFMPTVWFTTASGGQARKSVQTPSLIEKRRRLYASVIPILEWMATPHKFPARA